MKPWPWILHQDKVGQRKQEEVFHIFSWHMASWNFILKKQHNLNALAKTGLQREQKNSCRPRCEWLLEKELYPTLKAVKVPTFIFLHQCKPTLKKGSPHEPFWRCTYFYKTMGIFQPAIHVSSPWFTVSVLFFSWEKNLSEEMENLQQSLNAVVLQLLQNQAAPRTWVWPSLAEFGGQWW